MLDILYSIFTSIVHGITTLLNTIIRIPSYLSAIVSFLNYLCNGIAVPLAIATLVSVIIAIKRLIL